MTREQAVDIVRAGAGASPAGPLTAALLAEAERLVRGDALLSLVIGARTKASDGARLDRLAAVRAERREQFGDAA